MVIVLCANYSDPPVPQDTTLEPQISIFLKPLPQECKSCPEMKLIPTKLLQPVPDFRVSENKGRAFDPKQ